MSDLSTKSKPLLYVKNEKKGFLDIISDVDFGLLLPQMFVKLIQVFISRKRGTAVVYRVIVHHHHYKQGKQEQEIPVHFPQKNFHRTGVSS